MKILQDSGVRYHTKGSYRKVYFLWKFPDIVSSFIGGA